MHNRMRSLSLAVAVAGSPLLAPALFLSQMHGLKEQTGSPAKLTISISTDLNPVLVKIARTNGFPRDEGLHLAMLLTEKISAADPDGNV